MIVTTSEQMKKLGQAIGSRLRGGEVIELIGDVGTGKTTLTHGIAQGLGINEPITSPSFTINCNYSGRDSLVLHHYDFYRLNNAGIIGLEIAESINDPLGVTIVEWAENIRDILPSDRITINIDYLPTNGRKVEIITTPSYEYLTTALPVDLN